MTKKPRPTCGTLYAQALRQYAQFDPEKIRLFAPGFVLGQAEKVYSGACRAAMFRPGAEWHELIREACLSATTIYAGLAYAFCQRTGEHWLYRQEWSVLVEMVLAYNADAHLYRWSAAKWQQYHTLRGRLCGIPESDIDPAYHVRADYRGVTDRLEG